MAEICDGDQPEWGWLEDLLDYDWGWWEDLLDYDWGKLSKRWPHTAEPVASTSARQRTTVACDPTVQVEL